MVTPRIARPVERPGNTIIDGSQTSRPIVAGLARLADAATGAWRSDVADGEADDEAAFQIEREQLERQRAATIADRAGARAQLAADIDLLEIEARQAAQAGAVGYGDKIAEDVKRRYTEFRGTLGNDPEVRQRFEPLLQGDEARTIAGARAFELIEFGKYQGGQYEKAVVQAENDVRKTPSAETWQRLRAESDLLLDRMKLPAATIDKMRTERDSRLTSVMLDAQIEGGNTAVVRDILAKGGLDAYLTDDDKQGLQRKADAFENAQRIAAERMESAAREAAGDVVKAVEAIVEAGGEPTPAQMAEVRKAAKLLTPDEQVEVAALDVDIAVNRSVRGMNANAMRREAVALRAKVESGHSSQNEQFMLMSLERRLDKQQDREAEHFKGMIAQGPSGRIAAIDQTAAMDQESRFAVLEKAEPGLGHIAVLPLAVTRRKAVDGREIRRARKELVPVADAGKAFRSHVGGVGALLGGQYDDKMELAMDLYAADAASRGIDKFNLSLFWQNTQLAFGAVKQGDEWLGGLGTVNGRRTVVPDGLSEASFRRTIARTDWSSARDASGRPVSKAFITSHMVPVMVEEDDRNTRYRMVDGAGNELRGPAGETLFLSVKKARR